MSIMGTRVRRTEDPRLLTAGGTYTEDLRVRELAGAAQVTFVRSPMAHARITGVDASEARGEPGVIAVLTADDVNEPPADGDPFVAEPLLARDRVRYVGEPVAIVLTDERYQGEDAAELVSVDYEPLPAVASIDAALDGGTLLFPGTESNVAGSGGDLEPDPALFDGCDVVVERTITNQRLAAVPLEVRSAAAVWADDRLTLWLSTQNAQIARGAAAGKLGLDPGAVRVVAPDVGGGFGAKIGVDRDALVVAWAAKHTGRPVRWVETRSENMIAMTHGRGQKQTYKIGGTRDGRILAYRLEVVQDCGGYQRFGVFLATLTRLMTSGAYAIPRVEGAYRGVVTNTTPIAAYRGAGRPEATAAIERAVDDFAAEIGVDPAQVRRLNVVPPDRFPYETPTGAMYDSGEYARALDKVLEAGGYQELRAEQARRRERGDVVQIGLGLSSYVEITAGDSALGETGRVVVHDDDTVTVYTGSSAHGQGHDTSWAMLIAEQMGIPMKDVTVKHGDTDEVSSGIGTYGSRSLQLGGSAVFQAAQQLTDTGRGLAAEMAGASEDEVSLDKDRGMWTIKAGGGIELTWGKVAGHAGPDGLSADVNFKSDRPTFPFGSHLAVVEVDTETGKVTLVRHVTADDAGTILNPVLAEGQRHGGIAQGAAQALQEEVLYDPDGNPLTGTLVDYAAISATDLPSFELLTSQTPTDLNPLGAKGIGEAGTIGATPAVQNAVIDAVAHLGIRHIEMPATPQRVWTAITKAKEAQ
jgi:aerobic carbon-monoxide dehydrogenase large subunit